MDKYLKRLIKVGGSVIVVLPKPLVKEFSDYVWIELRDGVITIRKAKVE